MDIPVAALDHLPVLIAEQRQYWPDAPIPWLMAGQVEQETCITPTHRFCWSPRAENQRPTEYGFGLGQLTITPRFDNFKAARELHNSLAAWEYEDRYRADYQLRTMVLMDRAEWRVLRPLAATDTDGWAMTLSAYNGGRGGVLTDRKLCALTDGCDRSRWFGHVETVSTKSRVASGGYRQSYYQINRDYVRRVFERAGKYQVVWK